MKISIIVFLLIIMFLLPTACKKEKKAGSENVYPKIEVVNTQNHTIPIDQKETTTACENGYFFKVSYNDKIQIKQFNFETLKEEIIGKFNYSFDQDINDALAVYTTFSPDRKKIAFLGKSPRKEFNETTYYDLYVMNIDGSDLKRITFDMGLIPTGEGPDLLLLFTPNSQELIVSSSHWFGFTEKAIYIIYLIQNKCMKYDENNPLLWPMRSYVDQHQYFISRKEVTPILPNGEEYLVWHQTDSETWQKTEIGTFNWKKKEYKKICSSPIPKSNIISATCSPDFSKIIFKVDERDYDYEGTLPYHIFLYDIPHKKFIKIADITQESEDIYSQYHVLDNWKYLLFFSDKKLWSFQLASQQKKEIKAFDKRFSLFPDDEKRCIIQDHNNDVFLFTAANDSLKKLLLPESSSNFILLDNSLFFVTKGKLAKYDLSLNKYRILNNQELSFSQDPFFLPERQLFCFYDEYANILTILDTKGHQIAKVNAVLFQITLDLANNRKSDDFFYFTFQSKPPDLYYAKSIQDKPINLTQGQFPVLRSELSPDQQNIAFYSLDHSTNIASVHLLNLATPGKVTTLASFTLNYHQENPSHEEYLEHYYSQDSYEHFLTLSWSKDSQWIYFVTRDTSKHFMIFRAKSDGKEMTLLSDPKSSSFSSMISPDSTQIVYVTGEERKIALMNADGTNKMTISDLIATHQCFFPAWSPDGKMIAFNQLMVEDRYDNNTSPSNQIMIITLQGKVIAKIDCMFIDPGEPQLESIQAKNYWSYSSNYFSCLQSVDNSGAGEGLVNDSFHIGIWSKYFTDSNLIQPITHRFKWAHSKDILMLFEWATSKDEIYHFANRIEGHDFNNTIQLYGCNTKQFTTVTKDVFYVFDAAWSPEDTEVLYAGTDMLSGQVVFKVAKADGSTEELLLSFGENPLEQPSSIADIDELVWLKE